MNRYCFYGMWALTAMWTMSCTFEADTNNDENNLSNDLKDADTNNDENNLSNDLKDLDNLEDDLEDLIDEVEDIAENTVICDGMTLTELMEATTISDGCKITVQDFLPDAEENFTGRLVVLGTEENDEDGSLSIFLHGADGDGDALSGDAFEEATVSVNGTALESGDFSVTLSGELSGELLSLGILNDYSGSMNESDLDTVADIETDLMTYLPQVHETEVTYFSTEVSVKQPFTSDAELLLNAVARDDDFERDLTALYDGMGMALDSLITRSRPIRLLMVSTDGAENESKIYEKAALIQTLTDNGIIVVVLGALFADIDEMKELMGPYGVFFYAPVYGDLKALVSEYIDSLREMVEIRIPADSASDRPIVIEAGGVSATIE